jgi:branched-subunit amino acid aminotransferase/4-amino-4-deoxychorismate lyase
MIKYSGINGQILSLEKAVFPVSDLATLRGYGIFDYFLFLKNQPLFIEDYLDRFYKSSQLMFLEVPLNREELKKHIQELINANGQNKGSIRLLLTGGDSPDGYTPGSPNLAVLQYMPSPVNPDLYEKGIKLMMNEYTRELPEIKTINYLNGIRLLGELKSKNAHEPLYHFGGLLRETVRSNVFIVDGDGVMHTPDAGILMGITRKKIIEIAPKLGISLKVGSVPVEVLSSCREVFVTGSNKKVMPVIEIDDMTIGNGKPGPVFQKIQHAFEELSNS